jgi:ribosomal-protein-alanine N-acetyltransferase
VIQTLVQTLPAPPTTSAVAATTNWQQTPPVLVGAGVTLRELRLPDAASLYEHLSTEEVSRIISPPPSSVAGFERFIEWTHRERSAGRFVCFGITPDDSDHAVGIIQVRALARSFEVAEWGFAIGSRFWGCGLFPAAAREVLAFTFTSLGVHRLEARSAVDNGRGNGALQKIGATRESILQRSFLRDGVYHDQVMWSICAGDWQAWQSAPPRSTSH